MKAADRIYVHDTSVMDWEPTGRPGISQKAVRTDAERGHYLGLVAFEPLARTGLHRHLGVGGGYILAGCVTDYHSDQQTGDYSVNHKSTVHEALAYTATMLATRLEAPQVFLNAEDVLKFSNGGRQASAEELATPEPEVPPDLLFTLRDLRVTTTKVAGVSRRLIFDYANTGSDHRTSQLNFLPRTRVPKFRTTALTEFFMLGGQAKVNGVTVPTAGYCILEPDAAVEISTDQGANIICWSEGRILWADDDTRPDLFGF